MSHTTPAMPWGPFPASGKCPLLHPPAGLPCPWLSPHSQQPVHGPQSYQYDRVKVQPCYSRPAALVEKPVTVTLCPWVSGAGCHNMVQQSRNGKATGQCALTGPPSRKLPVLFPSTGTSQAECMHLPNINHGWSQALVTGFTWEVGAPSALHLLLCNSLYLQLCRQGMRLFLTPEHTGSMERKWQVPWD